MMWKLTNHWLALLAVAFLGACTPASHTRLPQLGPKEQKESEKIERQVFELSLASRHRHAGLQDLFSRVIHQLNDTLTGRSPRIGVGASGASKRNERAVTFYLLDSDEASRTHCQKEPNSLLCTRLQGSVGSCSPVDSRVVVCDAAFFSYLHYLSLLTAQVFDDSANQSAITDEGMRAWVSLDLEPSREIRDRLRYQLILDNEKKVGRWAGYDQTMGLMKLVATHEVGHIVLNHPIDGEGPRTQFEAEADQFAVTALHGRVDDLDSRALGAYVALSSEENTIRARRVELNLKPSEFTADGLAAQQARIFGVWDTLSGGCSHPHGFLPARIQRFVALAGADLNIGGQNVREEFLSSLDLLVAQFRRACDLQKIENPSMDLSEEYEATPVSEEIGSPRIAQLPPELMGSAVYIFAFRDSSATVGVGFPVSEGETTGVVTAYHLIQGAKDVVYTNLQGGVVKNPRVLAFDPGRDLVLLEHFASVGTPLAISKTGLPDATSAVVIGFDEIDSAFALEVGVRDEVLKSGQWSNLGTSTFQTDDLDLLVLEGGFKTGMSGAPIMVDGKVIGMLSGVENREKSGLGWGIPAEQFLTMKKNSGSLLYAQLTVPTMLGGEGAQPRYRATTARSTRLVYERISLKLARVLAPMILEGIKALEGSFNTCRRAAAAADLHGCETLPEVVASMSELANTTAFQLHTLAHNTAQIIGEPVPPELKAIDATAPYLRNGGTKGMESAYKAMKQAGRDFSKISENLALFKKSERYAVVMKVLKDEGQLAGFAERDQSEWRAFLDALEPSIASSKELFLLSQKLSDAVLALIDDFTPLLEQTARLEEAMYAGQFFGALWSVELYIEKCLRDETGLTAAQRNRLKVNAALWRQPHSAVQQTADKLLDDRTKTQVRDHVRKVLAQQPDWMFKEGCTKFTGSVSDFPNFSRIGEQYPDAIKFLSEGR